MKLEIINPEALGAPRGWTNGLLAPRDGRILFIAGQAGFEPAPAGTPGASAPPPDFAGQFTRALDRVLAVIQAAGGMPTDLARLTVYVTDLAAYRANRHALGAIWRARLGQHYPTMALLEVKGLVDAGAVVEMEGTAVIGGST
jgi:enamine deaminase RidA (YjgF/YER057c/UK114 family)